VAFIYGLTGIGYQGVLLAEIARIAPPGMAGVVTGGAVFFAYLGMITFPGSFGLILALTGSYQTAFVILGAVPIMVGVMLFRSVRRQEIQPS
jgi:nitrate/nitrite transporter NarK